MAKERADKPRKEKVEKTEKVSKDKVKKHKKEKKQKKSKHEDDLEIYDDEDEPTKVKDTPAKVEESSAEPIPEPEINSEKEDKKAKKSKKEKKSKKTAVEEAIAEGAPNDIALPARPASKDSDEDGGAPLFAINTNATPVDFDSIATKAASTRENDKKKPLKGGITPPPSGLNRQARRRIRMIAERREKIQKDLGVPEGSLEKQDEVQAELDAWTAVLDGKTFRRMEKKHQRRGRNVTRLRRRSGKLMTERRFKEREKEVRKIDKKAPKKFGGLSANNKA
ncbi:hypothetical protein F4781DRAFT_389262 [Annulohypoxylon bovei var. microspora]|nr:hypothetical protein F4781DRAFT_389262 [Annulohypoxylon bovei var. microspora]